MITNQEQQLNIGVHNRGNDILIIFDCDEILPNEKLRDHFKQFRILLGHWN